MTTSSAVRARPRRSERRIGGWRIASRRARACGSSNTIFASFFRSTPPDAPAALGKHRTMARAFEGRSRARRAAASASRRPAPHNSASRPAMVLFPEAMPPTTPIRTRDAGRSGPWRAVLTGNSGPRRSRSGAPGGAWIRRECIGAAGTSQRPSSHGREPRLNNSCPTADAIGATASDRWLTLCEGLV